MNYQLSMSKQLCIIFTCSECHFLAIYKLVSEIQRYRTKCHSMASVSAI